jgi:hypothetical protein
MNVENGRATLAFDKSRWLDDESFDGRPVLLVK